MKNIIYLMVIGTILSCKTNLEIEKSELNYNIEIDYFSTPVEDSTAMYNEFLYVDFVGNYNLDTVSLYINGEFFAERVFGKDEVVGSGDCIKAIEYDKVKNIGIRINNGKLIYIEPESRHYNIQVKYVDDNVLVRFYRLLPAAM